MIVHLTMSQFMLAQQVAIMRRGKAVQTGSTDNYRGDLNDPNKLDVVGTTGEVAVAKALDKFWDMKVGPASGDVGLLEVRATDHPVGHLLLHHRDPDTAIFILARVLKPCEVLLAGWCHGNDGKKPENWGLLPGTKTGQECFVVPNELVESRSMDDLLAMRHNGDI